MGWNAARLARRADISNTAMYGIWNDTTDDPGIRTLEKIARALGVKVSALMEENGGDQGPHGKIEESIEDSALAA
jgi:transcriptional regulator with XRE-family HTH domain